MTVNVFKPTLKQLEEFKCLNLGEGYKEGPKLMLTIEDEPVCVYASTEHYTCVELHCYISENIYKYSELFTEMTKEMTDKCFTIFKTHSKLVLFVKPKHANWAQKLGFNQGTMPELNGIEGEISYIKERK